MKCHSIEQLTGTGTGVRKKGQKEVQKLMSAPV